VRIETAERTADDLSQGLLNAFGRVRAMRAHAPLRGESHGTV
jgi:hypothetical protein